MTLAAAFIADITDHPEDDAPRLIYADWLQENGDPERAEFIRAQCELARPRLAGGSDRRRELARRVKGLFKSHWERWATELGPWCPKWLEGWARGFPMWVGLSTTLKQAANELPAILTSAPVRSVRLIIEKVIAAGEGAALAACPALARLRGLELCGQSLGPSDQGWERMRGEILVLLRSPYFRQLEEFELIQLPLGNSGLAPLLAMERLHILRFYSAGLDEQAGQIILRSPVAARLTELRLTDGVSVKTARLVARTPALARLRVLDFDQGGIGDAGARLLAGAAHLSSLRELGLYRCDIGNAGAAALADSPYLTKLRVLNLSRNRVLYAGARSLIASTTLPRGMYLDLWDNEMEDYTPEIRRGLRERFGKVNFGRSR
jgi:uncharacterized protein (TIGR02996 family)